MGKSGDEAMANRSLLAKLMTKLEIFENQWSLSIATWLANVAIEFCTDSYEMMYLYYHSNHAKNSCHRSYGLGTSLVVARAC